ncbi:MAG TPA: phosphotransferase family protein [Candidatus Acidoferrales bacterium]|nr:phosphotransferase family protein [Candidatus Acidoferrales bacterium]
MTTLRVSRRGAELGDLRRGERPITALVARVPPRQGRLPSAQDVFREFRALAALHPHGVPVPAPLGVLWSAQDQVPVLVEEYVPGVVIHADDGISPLGQLPVRASMSLAREALGGLVRVHQVSLSEVTLGSDLQAATYFRRQVTRWNEQVERSTHRDTARWENLLHRIFESLGGADIGPAVTGVVHGDYDFHNLLFNKYPMTEGPGAKLEAILDWEMCTVGDVRADVGWLASRSHDDLPLTPLTPRASVLGRLGIRQGEVVAMYEEMSGRSCGPLEVFIALARAKQAAIWLGHHARTRSGVRTDPRFDTFAQYRDDLFEAWLAPALKLTESLKS